VLANPSAPPDKQQKYARPERERRFLLAGLPPGEVVQTATITDRYFARTRLRLRKTIEVGLEGTRTVYKLTQKIPAPHGGPGLITTIYLDEEEHERFSALPGSILRKNRYSIPPFGLDVFAGLVLAEVEFESEDEMLAFSPPSWAFAEVTADVRFTGGRLVAMSTRERAALLAERGIGRG
jgi:CYTH domain-containing protein